MTWRLLAWAVFFSSLVTLRAEAAPRFKAVAFDYFVIFNADSIVPAVEKEFPGRGQELTRLWRTKLFEYGYLRSITGDHRDFFAVTGDALTYVLAAQKLTAGEAARQRLLQAWLQLEPWPDTADGLRKLRAAGVKIITIANFSSKMLRDNASHAGLTPLFDELVSTEVNRTYKPDAKAYALGMEHLGLRKEEIAFAAFGGWDAYGAKKFGYPTYWCNRFHLPPENLGTTPDATGDGLGGLLEFVLGQ